MYRLPAVPDNPATVCKYGNFLNPPTKSQPKCTKMRKKLAKVRTSSGYLLRNFLHNRIIQAKSQSHLHSFLAASHAVRCCLDNDNVKTLYADRRPIHTRHIRAIHYITACILLFHMGNTAINLRCLWGYMTCFMTTLNKLKGHTTVNSVVTRPVNALNYHFNTWIALMHL